MTQHSHLRIGIDGGGTRCRALLTDSQGKTLARAEAGMANVATDINAAQDSIVEACRLALDNAGFNDVELSTVEVAAGLAGAHLPEITAILDRWQHPFANLNLCTDIEASCWAAHRSGTGAVIIIGTGSSAGQLDNGRFTQFGGHGFTLGDQASGAWIGKALLQMCLLHLDGLSEETADTRALIHALPQDNAAALIDHFHHAQPQQFAALAPLVFEHAKQGNALALSIVSAGADYLLKLISKASQDGHLPLAIRGGLAEVYMPYLPAELADCLKDDGSLAETGAIRCAAAYNATGQGL